MVSDIEPAAISAARRAGKAAVGGKIATGNRLHDGMVVYLDETGAWTADIDRARIARSAEDELQFKAALDAAVAANQLIDPAVIDTVVAATKPARLREQIRAVGPTVRPDLARRSSW